MEPRMTGNGTRFRAALLFGLMLTVSEGLTTAVTAKGGRSSRQWTDFHPTGAEARALRDFRQDYEYHPVDFPGIPPAVAKLMLYAQMQHGFCTVGPESEAMRNCNRWYRTATLLERHGWCYGGGEITAENKWQRCSTTRGYHHDYYRGPIGPPYTEQQIRAARQAEERDPAAR